MNDTLFTQDITVLDFLIRVFIAIGFVVVVTWYQIDEWRKSRKEKDL